MIHANNLGSLEINASRAKNLTGSNLGPAGISLESISD